MSGSGIDTVTLRWAAGAALLAVLLLLSLIDLQTRRLPDRIVLPALWAGLLANAFGLFVEPSEAILGAAGGYLALYGLSKLYRLRPGAPRAFGGGDLKLAAMLGAWLGLRSVPFALLVAFLSGTLAVLPGLLLGRLRITQTIPFGPALALGGAVVLLAGHDAIWRFLAG